MNLSKKIIEELKEDEAINASAGRTDKFVRAAVELGDYLDTLRLSAHERKRLFDLIIKQVNQGEVDAFIYGASVGIVLVLDGVEEDTSLS
jgi:hypothetical protein